MLEYATIAALISAALHLFLVWRLVWAPARRGPIRARALIASGANCIFVPTAMVVCLNAPAAWADWAVPCARVAFLDLSLVFMAAVCLALRDAARWLVTRSVARARGRSRQATAPGTSTRRAFSRGLVDACTLGVAALLGAIGYAQAVLCPPVRRTRVTLGRRPAEGGASLRLVQVSDLHLGPTVRGDYLAAVVDRVLVERPDVVAITGDLVDGHVDQLLRELAALERLARAAPVFFVTGNHEYFYRAEEWLEALRRLGLRVLVNEHHVLTIGDTEVAIAGVTDEAAEALVPAHRTDLLAAARDIAPAAVKILLSHRADAADRAAALGFDLHLCGHTHGGQFLPLAWLAEAAPPHVGWRRVGAMHLHVSPGTGYWGPINRLGVPPEITSIELRA